VAISFMLPGLVVCSYQSDRDFEAIYNIIHGCKDADYIDPYSTLENLPSLQEVQEGFADTDPHNAVIVEKNGQPIAYNRIIWWTEADGLTLYLHLGQVLPEFRGQGIGSALLHWSETRIREMAVEHGGEAMFAANASSTENDATRLLLDNGYQAAFSLAQMEYLISDDLHAIPVPMEIEIRAPHPNDATKMWQARVKAYTEIPLVGTSAPDESEVDELREEIEKVGQWWRIVWVGDEIAAQIWCDIADYEDSKTGMMNEVHTVPEFQHRGIGRLLMIHTLLMFKEANVGRIRLHTLEDNRRGAKTFYEKMGFKTVKTFPRYRKPL